MWYFRKDDCNWNTVCNGGAGMLALALGDDSPLSARVLALAEEGIRHYFEFLDDDGAWPEGIGYWGYGHRYGYMYLLSHERAVGRPHPLLERTGSRNTLRFPFLFSPHQVATGFGDSNHFFPLPFVYLAAERYEMPEIAEEMDRRLLSHAPDHEGWPNTAELLLYHPGDTQAVVESPWPRFVGTERHRMGLHRRCLAATIAVCLRARRHHGCPAHAAGSDQSLCARRRRNC